MHKNLSQMAAHEKGLWSDVVVPDKIYDTLFLKNIFFL